MTRDRERKVIMGTSQIISCYCYLLFNHMSKLLKDSTKLHNSRFYALHGICSIVKVLRFTMQHELALFRRLIANYIQNQLDIQISG